MVRLALHVQPGARRNSVVGVHGDALKIAVSAPPVDGKANDAICSFVASLIGVPARSVSIVAGATARRKIVAISDSSLGEIKVRLDQILTQRA